MDVDQYFPMRILTAVKQTARGTPIVVYAVGVSKNMTRRGVGMFGQIFKRGNLIQTSVRDHKSQENWVHHFRGDPPIVSRDPGLLVAETYGIGAFTKPMRHGRKVIAFGVSDPASMAPHSDGAEGVMCGDIEFYLHTLTLLAPEYDIRMFTNGEDYKSLDRIATAIKTLSVDVQKNITVLPRALKPPELVRQITDADAIIAHRLHANIIAYSHGIPHIGLGWDEKLRSFFAAIDRREFIIVSNSEAPTRVQSLLKRALSEGIDRNTHTRLMADVNLGLDELARAIIQKIHGKPETTRT